LPRPDPRRIIGRDERHLRQQRQDGEPGGHDRHAGGRDRRRVSAVLWLYHFNPDSTLLGKYSQQLAAGGQMADQLGLLAFWFGAIAVVLGIIAGLGGKGGSTSILSILLGIAAMSYPVLTALNVVKHYVPNPIG
jgi:hypothetical protein